MGNEIRLGKVSAIDYPTGMVRVVYHEKDDSVTRLIPLISAEYGRLRHRRRSRGCRHQGRHRRAGHRRRGGGCHERGVDPHHHGVTDARTLAIKQ